MRFVFAFLVIIIFPCWLLAQINQYGVPFITNYTPQEYEASEQNWAIVQDQRGVMYIGNDQNGILEFDGVKWKRIATPNNSTIRSMTIDKNGRIFIGAVGEIGFLIPDSTGLIKFNTLNSLIDSSSIKFADVWKTYCFGDQILFCTTKELFILTNDKLEKVLLPKSSFFTFVADNEIYIGNYLNGLTRFNDGVFDLVKNGDFFSKKGIYTINKINSKLMLIGAYPQGLYTYHEDGRIESSIQYSDANKYLVENQLYHSLTIDSQKIAFATLDKGIIIQNKLGKIIDLINKNTNLQDETVIYLYKNTKNANDPLLAALNNGISKIEIESPIRKFDYLLGLEGAVNDIIIFNNTLYVATFLGVYYKGLDKNNCSSFVKVLGINNMVWSLQHSSEKDHLLVGTTAGLFKIDKKGQVQDIDYQIMKVGEPNSTNYITKLYKFDNSDDQLLIGKINGLLEVELSDGKWQRNCLFKNISEEIRYIQQLDKNSIWLGTNYNGVINIQFSDNDTTYNYYNKESGLPSLDDIFIQKINGRLLFGTEKGLYHFNESIKLFEPDSLFGKEFCNGSFGVFRFNQSTNGYYWFSLFNDKRKWVERGRFDSTGIYVRDTLPFKRLPNEQFDAIYHDSAGITWLGSSSGLYSFNSNVEVDYCKPYHALVRKVTTVNDSVLFWGTNYTTDTAGIRTVALAQPTELIPVLDYSFNDLTFEYAAPYFIEEKKTEYSYLLDGYKDTWSKWTTEPKAVFTNLREGKYTFSVKAKNIYGVESTIATYQFSILPPWYRTILAYIFYGILAILVVILIVKLYTRKLEQEKITLEGIVHQRTAEIRCQKEDIERKSEILKVQKEEIEVQAIHLGRANKILHEQKEEIFKQKEEITSSIKYAKRIQRAIVPSEEEAQRLLKDYFLLWRPRDIVSGDFWWMGEKDNLVVVAAADCTGHGVPGAFMSMLGVSFLNEIVNQQDNTQSHEILNKLRTKVKSTLGQTGKDGEAKDGMDIALMVIDFEKQLLQYSGAYNPMYLCRNNELIEFKADKNPIGIYIKEKESFTQNIVELQKGDTLYIFSDGYVDQFGGENQMKYMSKRFKEFLLTIQSEPMEKQKELLNISIDEWRGKIEQIDDIIVLGVRIT